MTQLLQLLLLLPMGGLLLLLLLLLPLLAFCCWWSVEDPIWMSIYLGGPPNTVGSRRVEMQTVWVGYMSGWARIRAACRQPRQDGRNRGRRHGRQHGRHRGMPRVTKTRESRVDRSEAGFGPCGYRGNVISATWVLPSTRFIAL